MQCEPLHRQIQENKNLQPNTSSNPRRFIRNAPNIGEIQKGK